MDSAGLAHESVDDYLLGRTGVGHGHHQRVIDIRVQVDHRYCLYIGEIIQGINVQRESHLLIGLYGVVVEIDCIDRQLVG